MIYFTIFEAFLCLSTIGTVVPTIHLGKKLNSCNRPTYFILSGAIVGIIFSMSDLLYQIGYKNFFGIHTWVPVCLNLTIFVFVMRSPALSLKSALEINLVLQMLLIFSCPISNHPFIENNLLSQMVSYIVFTGAIVFVFYNASLFMRYAYDRKDLVKLGTYLYIVLLVFIAFRPITETSSYITLIIYFSSQLKIACLEISLFINLVLLPFLSFVPFRIMKSLISN